MPHGGRRHPDLQDLRRVGDLPRRADLRRRRRRSTTRWSRSSSAWARGCSTDGRGRARSPARAFDGRRARASCDALGQSCVEPRRAWPASRPTDDDKVLLAPLPVRPRRARARTRSSQEKLMPVLGLVRSPSVEHAIARLRAGHRARRPRPHLGRLRHRRGRDRRASPQRDPHRADPRQRADRGRRAGRRLQLDDADLLARLRHLGRLDHDRQRQLPQPAQHQDGLAPPGAAAVVPRARRTPTSTPARSTACAQLRRRSARDRHRRRRPRRAGSPTRCAATSAPAACTSSPRSSPSRPRRRSAPAWRCSTSCDADADRRGRRRLGDRRREGDAAVPREPGADARELTLPFLDARKRVAALPARSSTRCGWSRCRRPPAPARRSRRPRCSPSGGAR